jgi:hypothetical protein
MITAFEWRCALTKCEQPPQQAFFVPVPASKRPSQSPPIFTFYHITGFSTTIDRPRYAHHCLCDIELRLPSPACCLVLHNFSGNCGEGSFDYMFCDARCCAVTTKYALHQLPPAHACQHGIYAMARSLSSNISPVLFFPSSFPTYVDNPFPSLLYQ